MYKYVIDLFLILFFFGLFCVFGRFSWVLSFLFTEVEELKGRLSMLCKTCIFIPRVCQVIPRELINIWATCLLSRHMPRKT